MLYIIFTCFTYFTIFLLTVFSPLIVLCVITGHSFSLNTKHVVYAIFYFITAFPIKVVLMYVLPGHATLPKQANL